MKNKQDFPNINERKPEGQKDDGSKYKVLIVDDEIEILHDRVNLKGMAPITEKEYFVRGTTALLDAMGKTISKVGNAQKHSPESERAEKVIFVITTDGMENASREYSYEKVREMVERQKAKYGWDFIFLGANIDAVAEARRFGIDEDRAARFNSDAKGTAINYEVVGHAVRELRANRNMERDWKKRIEEDYKDRGGR